MHVPILAVAFSIYILGIAIMLYLRPSVMFRPGGSWKEFGVGRGENYTVIPFWLFAIFWAFISYGVGLVIMSQLANIALGAFPEQVAPSMTMPPQSMPQMQSMPQVQSMPQIQSPTPNFIKPVSSLIGIPNSQPGYYVLQNNALPGSQAQYVYYGTSPPPMQ
jgi:hypothetical protein